jgi:SH3-like domain-containing protein
MSKLDAIEKKLAHLESRFYFGQVRSTDDNGQEVWIKGSGLEFMRTVLKAKRALGEEALPKDLQEEARLWSRAELPVCGLSDMVKEICRGLIDEAG